MLTRAIHFRIWANTHGEAPVNVWNFARSPASVLLMIEYGRSRKLAPSALLKGTQLTQKQLADPDFTVLAAQELAVASNLLKLTGNEADLGLKLGLSYHLSAYGLLGYGLLSSATGMAAMALARRYLALTYTYVGIAFRRARRGPLRGGARADCGSAALLCRTGHGCHVPGGARRDRQRFRTRRI